MSHEIEFNREAYQFESEDEFGSPTQSYIIANIVGSSNAFDHDGNIARRWQVVGIGTETDLMEKLVSYTRPIERGALRYQNGRTKIENYVKNWRGTINDAGDMGDFQQNFWKAEATVYDIDRSELSDVRDDVEEAYETARNDWRRSQPEDEDKLKFTTDIRGDNIETIELLYTHSAITPVHVTIRGHT